MPFSNEFLAMWEHIIDEVHKTEIPLECIKKVVIKLHGKKQRTINLQTLRRQGLDNEDLEIVLSRTLSELGDQVRDLEFLVDIAAVAEIVQPETDKLLSNLK
jgi:regulator of sigma D